METLIDKIVVKLQGMPIAKVETALELINSLDKQELGSTLSDSEKQTKWETFLNEYAGSLPDLPLVEEIRADMGEDAPRELL